MSTKSRPEIRTVTQQQELDKEKDKKKGPAKQTSVPETSEFPPPKARLNAHKAIFDGATVTGQASGYGADLYMGEARIMQSTSTLMVRGQAYLDAHHLEAKNNTNFNLTSSEDLLLPNTALHEERIKDLERRLNLDAQAKQEMAKIEANPALKAYYQQIKHIAWYFISGQAVAGEEVGEAKNKKDTAIALTGAGIASIPVPGLGVAAEVGKEIAFYFNNKDKHKKSERLADWSVGPMLASHMADCFARRLTLEREEQIRLLVKNNKGVIADLTRRIKTVLPSLKSAAKYSMAEKLAVADLLDVVKAIRQGKMTPSSDIDYVKQLESNVQTMLGVLGLGDIAPESLIEADDFLTVSTQTTTMTVSSTETPQVEESKKIKPSAASSSSSSSTSMSSTTAHTISILRASNLEKRLENPPELVLGSTTDITPKTLLTPTSVPQTAVVTPPKSPGNLSVFPAPSSGKKEDKGESHISSLGTTSSESSNQATEIQSSSLQGT